MLTLGIETSCDETSASVVRNGCEVLSSVVSSQVELHARFGGVVPELASRAHVERIGPVLEQAFSDAGCVPQDLSGIAVTQGPGLVGALLVGLHAAKGIAAAIEVPLAGVNHIEGHLYALFLEGETPPCPLVALIVSGGHTLLVYVSRWGHYEVWGETRDDAAGEAFDKVAKFLNMGYPGGPKIDRIASAFTGDPVRFPKARMKDGRPDFSFSGLKTAVLYHVRKLDRPVTDDDIAAIVTGFQDSVVDSLVSSALGLCWERDCPRLALVGGVACNRTLRERLRARGESAGVTLYVPSPKFCTDNAAMIAALGHRLLQAGHISGEDLDAKPNWGLGQSA